MLSQHVCLMIFPFFSRRLFRVQISLCGNKLISRCSVFSFYLWFKKRYICLICSSVNENIRVKLFKSFWIVSIEWKASNKITFLFCDWIEQERLLLSVLPEHVAVKVRQDLGSSDSEQFKKIYMSRHENVR